MPKVFLFFFLHSRPGTSPLLSTPPTKTLLFCTHFLANQGNLKGYDHTINLVLEGCKERIYSQTRGVEQARPAAVRHLVISRNEVVRRWCLRRLSQELVLCTPMVMPAVNPPETLPASKGGDPCTAVFSIPMATEISPVVSKLILRIDTFDQAQKNSVCILKVMVGKASSLRALSV